MAEKLEIVKTFTDKWQGKADIDNDVFWKECLDTYRSVGQSRLTLPFLDAPETRQAAYSHFKGCPEGCGKCCCNYEFVSINYGDLQRIINGTGQTLEQLSHLCTLLRKDGVDISWCIKAKPCPFLQQDKRCSIYESRPDVCRRYPIVSPTTENGQKRLAVSILCDSGADAGREMIKLHLRIAGGTLLPNLMIIGDKT